MTNTLVIQELRELAAIPNGFDEKILLQIQENLAVDVLRLHKREFADLIASQKAAGTPAADAERERHDLFARKLQSEYRNRVGQGFNLPYYVETAENYYRLEIVQHIIAVKNFLAQGKAVAEAYHLHNAYEIRNADPAMRDTAHRVADGLIAIAESLERLTRVRAPAAKEVADKLRHEMTTTLGTLTGEEDRLAKALLTEASTLADAKRHLAALERAEPREEVGHEAAALRP